MHKIFISKKVGIKWIIKLSMKREKIYLLNICKNSSIKHVFLLKTNDYTSLHEFIQKLNSAIIKSWNAQDIYSNNFSLNFSNSFMI